MPNFTVFERRQSGKRTRRGATVTVMRRGYLAFSEDAWTAVGSPAYVKFLIDTGEQNRVVGFRACGADDPDANVVKHGSRVVTAVALLKHLGHDCSVARRYTLRVKDGLPPYIDLDEDAPAARGSSQREGEPGCRT